MLSIRIVAAVKLSLEIPATATTKHRSISLKPGEHADLTNAEVMVVEGHLEKLYNDKKIIVKEPDHYPKHQAADAGSVTEQALVEAGKAGSEVPTGVATTAEEDHLEAGKLAAESKGCAIEECETTMTSAEGTPEHCPEHNEGNEAEGQEKSDPSDQAE